MTANDVHRIIQATSKTPTSKKDKGFKLYVSSYINNYEGKLTSLFCLQKNLYMLAPWLFTSQSYHSEEATLIMLAE